MAFKNYNINWNLFVRRIVDPDRRDAVTIKWIHSLIKILRDIHSQFLIKRNAILFRLLYNSQVFYLEKGLNDYFNSGNPAYSGLGINGNLSIEFGGTPVGIYIEHTTDFLPDVVIYDESDGFDGVIIYDEGDAPQDGFIIYDENDYYSQFDFIVKVPYSIFDFGVNPEKIDEIRAFVNLYNACGKRYNVINY